MNNMIKIAVLLSIFLIIIPYTLYSQEVKLPESAVLHAQAVEESLIPIRPGIPGESPFWNEHARRFIYAPAFNFNPVKNAKSYRFTATSEVNQKVYIFEALEFSAPLVPIWKELPVGYVTLKVEGMTGSGGEVIGPAGERRFYRAAVYNGPYHRKAADYRESGRRALEYLFNSQIFQYWKTEGKPYPGYGLYCYPSKMFPSVMRTMLRYSNMTAHAEEKETALQIAKNAIEYLITISQPAGTPLEFMPPTYTGQRYADMKDEFFGESMENQIMMIYPSGVGGAYLEMYELTQESRFFEAAVHIADSYKKHQLSSGSWPLIMDARTGKALTENEAFPGGIIGFLNRLADKYNKEEYREISERAQRWKEEHAVKEFNWEAQFEDQAPVEKYKNLSKGPAISYAMELFNNAGEDWTKIREAEELMRFAEDQFVVWEKPLDFTDWDSDSKVWITPCVLEQYNFYVPVSSSAASLIRAFKKAYDVTGKPLYLAKAIDLANSMTVAQDRETGRYPTYWERNFKLKQEGWINTASGCAGTMISFGKALEEMSRGNE